MISGIHDLIVVQLDDRVADYEIDGGFPGEDKDDAQVHAAAALADMVLLAVDQGFAHGLAHGSPVAVTIC